MKVRALKNSMVNLCDIATLPLLTLHEALLLTINGCRNLHGSLKHMISVDIVKGRHTYPAAQHGPQEAVRGIAILSLPPVLHVILRRKIYDAEQKSWVKVHKVFLPALG